MSRAVDENDLTNAMDLLRQEMNAVQDKALKLVIFFGFFSIELKL